MIGRLLPSGRRQGPLFLVVKVLDLELGDDESFAELASLIHSLEKVSENFPIEPAHIHKVIGVDVIIDMKTGPLIEFEIRVKQPIEVFRIELELVHNSWGMFPCRLFSLHFLVFITVRGLFIYTFMVNMYSSFDRRSTAVTTRAVVNRMLGGT